ncbi:unnamed protein product [Schistocephalus solidus]|uniref:Schwannomin-interacting protein 1 n=1 Tax=Schistocephalus solidus TaxID=70667 RepID=A0A183TNA6_SCHSO|nr:unnamed protein product [Schistocephalus solidus]
MLKNLLDGINLSFTTPDALEKEINQYWGDVAALEEEGAEEAVSRGQRLPHSDHPRGGRPSSLLGGDCNAGVGVQRLCSDGQSSKLPDQRGEKQCALYNGLGESGCPTSELAIRRYGGSKPVGNETGHLSSIHSEESMSCQQDRNQLAQITSENRRLLLETLEHLDYKLSLNSGVLAILEGVDLSTEDGIERC